MFDSTRIIGERQFNKGKVRLYYNKYYLVIVIVDGIKYLKIY